MTKKVFIVSCISIATILGGCAGAKRLSKELPKTFLEDVDLSSKKEHLPFDHAWSDPQVDWKAYHGVFIKPVRTDQLPSDAWTSSRSVAIPTENAFKESIDELAKYFHEQLVVEISKRNGEGLAKIAHAPGPGIAILEVALTELEFSHPLEKAGSLAVPVPAAAVVVSAISDPYGTFAMRVTDGVTGKLIASAADRKFAPSRVINLSKLSASRANREICELWAEEIAETVSSKGLTEVDETTWKVRPW